MKYTLIPIISFFLIANSFCQDIIHFNNNYKKTVKVLYINEKYIFYTSDESDSFEIKKIAKFRIKQIVFVNNKINEKHKTKKIDSMAMDLIITKNELKNSETTSINSSETIKTSLNKTNLDQTKDNEYKLNKRFGFGVDIISQNDDEKLAGISFDYYLNQIINVGLGYGFFYGEAKPYITTKVIIRSNKNNWSPFLSLIYTNFDHSMILKTKFNYLIKEENYPFFVPAIGYQYENQTGLSFDLSIGTSLIRSSKKLNFNGVILALRVAGHL